MIVFAIIVFKTTALNRSATGPQSTPSHYDKRIISLAVATPRKLYFFRAGCRRSATIHYRLMYRRAAPKEGTRNFLRKFTIIKASSISKKIGARARCAKGILISFSATKLRFLYFVPTTSSDTVTLFQLYHNREFISWSFNVQHL